jgi:hypothetical protein
MRWATSVMTSGAVYVFLAIDDRRRIRQGWAEWLSHWTSTPETESAKHQHAQAFFAWLIVGFPLAIVTAVLALGVDRWIGAEPLLMVWSAFMLTVFALLALHGLLWGLVPVRWPTRADRIRSGWPLEAVVVAAVVCFLVADL